MESFWVSPVLDAALLGDVVPGATIGAVAGTGGWFDSAPGMPEAFKPLLNDSLDCWLRIVDDSGGEFGR